MTKNLGIRAVVLLLILMVFSSSAVYADPLNFRLIIQVLHPAGAGGPTTAQVVLTDNGIGDLNTDEGVIAFNGQVGSSGHFSTTVAVTEAPTGGSILTLTGDSTWATSTQQIRIILEDLYPTTNTHGYLNTTVGGWEAPDLDADPLAQGVITDTGQIINGKVDFNTFVNFQGQNPDLGLDGVTSAYSALTMPSGTAGLSGATFTKNVGALDFGTTGAPVELNFDPASPNYGNFSVVTITPNQARNGALTFSLQASIVTDGDPLAGDTKTVPEPTSLLLLGSGLSGLGLLLRKKKYTA